MRLIMAMREGPCGPCEPPLLDTMILIPMLDAMHLTPRLSVPQLTELQQPKPPPFLTATGDVNLSAKPHQRCSMTIWTALRPDDSIESLT